MTLDEAIFEFKERAEDSRKISEIGIKSYIPKEKEEKQIAEWLEELKANKVTSAEVYEQGYKRGYKNGYNKAIDDLLEDANEMAIEVDTGTYTMKAIGIGLLEQITEQLKAGNINESN